MQAQLGSHQWGAVCFSRDTGHWQRGVRRFRAGCGGMTSVPLQMSVQQMHGSQQNSHSPWALHFHPSPWGFHPASSGAPRAGMHTRSSSEKEKATRQERNTGKVLVFPGQFCHVSAQSLGCSLPTPSSPVSMEISKEGLWASVWGTFGLQRTQHDVPAWDALLPC